MFPSVFFLHAGFYQLRFLGGPLHLCYTLLSPFLFEQFLLIVVFCVLGGLEGLWCITSVVGALCLDLVIVVYNFLRLFLL